MRRARIIAAAVATLLFGASVVAVTAEMGSTADAASSGCSVAYQVQSDWGTGFSLNLTVTNNGPAITGWTVSYSYSGNQTLTTGWSGNWVQSGKAITITNLSWNGSLATGGTASPGANFTYTGTNTAPTSISCSVTLASSPSPSPTPTPSSSPSPSPSPSASPSPTPTPTPTPTGSCGSGLTLQANPSTFSVAQGKTEVFGVSLNESPTASIPVTVAVTSGNSGLSISSGASITESSSNWNLPQPVYVAANTSGTGAATITISAPGCTSVTVTGTETAAGSGTTPSHAVNPFTSASWYVNPNYTAEADSSAASASGTLASQMQFIGTQPTFIWLDHIGAIYGGSDNASGINGTQRTSLAAQLQAAVTADSSGAPEIFPIVIYDLPDRDCAALASNGELSIANSGLTYYEQSYINPIAQILSDYQNTSLRIVAVI